MQQQQNSKTMIWTVSATLIALSLLACYTHYCKALSAVPPQPQQQNQTTLHPIDQKWITFMNRVEFAAKIKYGFDSAVAHMADSRLTLMNCVNIVAAKVNSTTNALARWNDLYECDQSITRAYAGDGDLGPQWHQNNKIFSVIGVSNGVQYWDDLAKMYLQARGIL